MNYLSKIQEEWNLVLLNLLKTRAFKTILNGDIDKELWGKIMVQSGHLAKYNPQIQAYATMFFKGDQEKIVRSFLKHAISEIGHDDLAYSDAKICGIKDKENMKSLPNTDTLALTALPLYLIQFKSPLCYLGYLFFLEFLPTSMGKDFMNIIIDKGIPVEATTFLQDHAEIDIGHNKLMEQYINKLITNDQELEHVISSLHHTSRLYERMIETVIDKHSK